MSKERERVLSVSLSEAQWKAFVAQHPEPARWLREQVLSQIEGACEPAPPHKVARADGPKVWSRRRV